MSVDSGGQLEARVSADNEVPQQRMRDKLGSMLGELNMNLDHLIQRLACAVIGIPRYRSGAPGGAVPVRADPAASVLSTECRARENSLSSTRAFFRGSTL